MRFVFLVLFTPLAAHAVEEDRGPRGFFVGGGGGVMVGTASDGDDVDAGGFFGNGGYLRLGEEVLPGFTLGLRFGGGAAPSNAENFEASLGGFALETSLRPFSDLPQVVLMGGVGVGGGEIEPKAPGDPEGSTGGTMLLLGLAYEFTVYGAPTDGLAVAPSVMWSYFPEIRGNPANLSAFLLGVETVWYTGR